MHDFIGIIEELITLFHDLEQVEKDKIAAAAKNRVTFVEECMTKEQAAILKLRGLDKNREACQEQMGFKDMTFSQILDHVSEEERDRLTPLFERLTNQLHLFQDASDAAKKIIELNLYKINSAITKQQESISYSEKGTAKKSATHLTSKKV